MILPFSSGKRNTLKKVAKTVDQGEKKSPDQNYSCNNCFWQGYKKNSKVIEEIEWNQDGKIKWPEKTPNWIPANKPSKAKTEKTQHPK